MFNTGSLIIRNTCTSHSGHRLGKHTQFAVRPTPNCPTSFALDLLQMHAYATNLRRFQCCGWSRRLNYPRLYTTFVCYSTVHVASSLLSVRAVYFKISAYLYTPGETIRSSYKAITPASGSARYHFFHCYKSTTTGIPNIYIHENKVYLLLVS